MESDDICILSVQALDTCYTSDWFAAHFRKAEAERQAIETKIHKDLLLNWILLSSTTPHFGMNAVDACILLKVLNSMKNGW